MNSVLCALLVFVTVGLSVWLVSFVVEVLRPKPKPPARLRWAPDIPIETIEVGSNNLRYIKSGKGPVLVLLHTLRTQLDLFEKIVPELSNHFTVYAFDYPGHGYSDIPKGRYDAEFFVKAVEGFLDKLDLRNITLAGVSIGGALALILAARRNSRVVRVIAVNPYDYKGHSLARGSLAGCFVNYASLIPFIGETVMRLRNFIVERAVIRGGVVDPNNVPAPLMKEIYEVGSRPGHYRAFIRLLRNAASWQAATKEYGRIEVPVLLIWGDQDWATPDERKHDASLIPGVEVKTVKRGGHFLPLDRSEELLKLIVDFAGK